MSECMIVSPRQIIHYFILVGGMLKVEITNELLSPTSSSRHKYYQYGEEYNFLQSTVETIYIVSIWAASAFISHQSEFRACVHVCSSLHESLYSAKGWI